MAPPAHSPANGYDWSSRYRNVVEYAARLQFRSAILDREIIVQDERGLSDFNALRCAMAWEPHRLTYFVFDLIYLNGEDLRRRPMLERKARLAELIPSDPFCPVQFCDHLAGDGSAVFKAADGMGLEGIVSKKASSTDQSGRSSAWLKIKCMTDGEFVVIGTSKGDGGPPVAPLAPGRGRVRLVYAGSTFVTPAAPARDTFWTRATQLATKPATEPLSD